MNQPLRAALAACLAVLSLNATAGSLFQRPSLSASVEPSTVESGGQATLSWSAFMLPECLISAAGQSRVVGATGSVSYPFTETTLITVTCRSSSRSLSETVVVTVVDAEPEPDPEPEPEPDPDPIPDPTPDPDPTPGQYPGVPAAPAIAYAPVAGNEVNVGTGTIPTMQGGNVYRITGTHRQSQIAANCSVASPCFLVGPATITGETWVSGSGLVTQDIHWTIGTDSGGTPRISGDHMVVRDSEVTGSLSSGGGRSSGTNIVWLRVRVHDNGNVNATNDQDRHGIKVGSGDGQWFLDGDYYGNSGDGIQIGDQNNAASAIRNIYVAGNRAWGNKQTGFWVKNARDVVFSQNTVRDLGGSGSSPGQCVGGQYEFEWVWAIENDCTNTAGVGFVSGSGQKLFILRNTVRNVPGSCDTGDLYDNCGIASRNRADVWVGENASEAETHIRSASAVYEWGNDQPVKVENASTVQYRGDTPPANSPYAMFQQRYGRALD